MLAEAAVQVEHWLNLARFRVRQIGKMATRIYRRFLAMSDSLAIEHLTASMTGLTAPAGSTLRHM